MEQLAKRYAADAHFLFVYVREAHPGEAYPPHQYYEQKTLHARSFRERLGIERTIAIDSLQGKVHRVYGGVSNMSWIIDHTGRVAYRAAWTVADDIERALTEIIASRELKRSGKSAATFYREIVGLRPQRAPLEGLPRFMGGAVAARQFEAAKGRTDRG